MKRFKKFLSVIIMGVCFMVVGNAFGATNNIDVGNYGVWATENNRELLTGQISNDISSYAGEFNNLTIKPDYVPAEARVGLAFINAMSYLSGILEISLIRFIVIFMIIMFAFWTAFEAYNMIQNSSKPMETFQKIIKRAIVITIWIAILEFGPAKLFMIILTPILGLATYISDFLLNAVAMSGGYVLPDTCAGIEQYVANSSVNTVIINPDQTAALLCVPTRLSGFFYTGISVGWDWMKAGVGNSAFTFIMGAAFIILCISNLWKFAIMAFGVIADLFLTLFMLPFTAIAQTFGGSDSGTDIEKSVFTSINEGSSGKTSYAGIAGNIFNQFLDLFKYQNLNSQINRIIQSSFYFVSLSIVITLCAILLSTIVQSDLMGNAPSLRNDGFFPALIALCLVRYIATKTDEIAKKFGGSIDTSAGDRIIGDVKKLWNLGKGSYKKYFGKK